MTEKSKYKPAPGATSRPKPDSPPEYNGNDWITDRAPFSALIADAERRDAEAFAHEVRTGQRLATGVLLAAVLTVAGLFLWGVM